MLLDTEAFDKAARFLSREARPLEVARFENIFNGSSATGVLRELKKFQNADGGFGHALEPDLRAPESTALCTSIAFQIMRYHHLPKEDEMLQQGLAYFMGTLDHSELHWRIIPPSASETPSAPWWNQEYQEKERATFSLNPTAEILGYLIDYGASTVDEAITSQITRRVLETLESLDTIEMHDLLCCLRLLETGGLHEFVRKNLGHELQRLITNAISTDPEDWKAYSLRPLQVIQHPDSPFVHKYQQALSLNLDYEINEQTEDGCWLPTWTWDDQHSKAWETAKREWSGVLTLDKLQILKRFRRISKSSR